MSDYKKISEFKGNEKKLYETFICAHCECVNTKWPPHKADYVMDLDIWHNKYNMKIPNALCEKHFKEL